MLIDHGTVRLKSGEEGRVYQLVAPEPSWAERVLPFLNHKGPLFGQPMQQALAEGLPGLRMNFFLLVLGEELVGNLTTVESLDPPLGMLQHVFTKPEHRRKGICQALLQVLTADFGSRGGRAMYLITGYDTPPFWLYHSFGFRGIGTTGAMRWLLQEDFDDAYFGAGPSRVRDSDWQDWAPLECLYLTEAGWYLRGLYFHQYGHNSYEGPYVALRDLVSKGTASGVKVLAREDGSVVGHAFLAQQPQWRNSTSLLGFFVHPNFEGQAADLLQGLPYPDCKVQCYCDSRATGRAAALLAAGFTQEAVLARQVSDGSSRLDIAVFSRGG